MRLPDPANLRFQRRVARPGISTAGSSARQIPDQGVGHVLLEQDAACRGHDLRLAEICQAAADGGDDPELDTLLLRLHTEKPAGAAGRSRCGPMTSTPASA